MVKRNILLSALLCVGIGITTYAQSGSAEVVPVPVGENAASEKTTLSKKELRKAVSASVSAAQYAVALKSLKDTTFILELDTDPTYTVKRDYNFLKVEDGRAYLQFTFSYTSRKTGADGNSYSKLEGNISSFEVKTDKKGNTNVHMLVQGETDPWIHGVRGPVHLRFKLYKDTNVVSFSGWRSMSCKGWILPISAVDKFQYLQGGRSFGY